MPQSIDGLRYVRVGAVPLEIGEEHVLPTSSGRGARLDASQIQSLVIENFEGAPQSSAHVRRRKRHARLVAPGPLGVVLRDDDESGRVFRAVLDTLLDYIERLELRGK